MGGRIHRTVPLRMRTHAYTIITIRKRRQSVASGTQLTSTTHFSCRRNIVGRLCISPTIVFLILSNQKVRVRAIISRRTFLCIWNMYFHQQRCLYKISNQKIPHFRCYDNIQPPVCSYIYINYYIYIYIIISFIQL